MKAGWINSFNNKNLTEVKFFCNLIELYRTKLLIERLINYSNILTSVYDKQKEILIGGKENLLTFKKHLKYYIKLKNILLIYLKKINIFFKQELY